MLKKSKSSDMLKYTAANNKATALYQKRLLRTYLKPEEEKALKKLSIKKQNSKSRLNNREVRPIAS